MTRATGLTAGVFFPGINTKGGAERLALDLAKALALSGYSVFFFSDEDVDRAGIEYTHGLDLADIEFVRVPRPPTALTREANQFLGDWQVSNFIKKFDLDLFFNEKYKSELPGCGKRSILYATFPYSPTLRETSSALRDVHWGVVRGARRASLNRLNQSFLSTYDEVWTISHFAGGCVVQDWGIKPRILYPACDQFPPSAPKAKLIVSVGRFQQPSPGVPYKGQDKMIEAFAGLSDLHERGWRLILAGGLGNDPGDQAYFGDLTRAIDGLPVELLPNIAREQLADLYGAATIYWHAQGLGSDLRANPHAQEHFGITTVEAMSAGAIPLVYGTAGPLEVVTPLGSQVTWKSLEELQTLTRNWADISPAELADMADRCRVRAEYFGFAHFERQVRALLDNSEPLPDSPTLGEPPLRITVLSGVQLRPKEPGEALLAWGAERIVEKGARVRAISRSAVGISGKLRDVVEHRSGRFYEDAVRGSFDQADAVVAFFEDRGLAILEARRAHVPPYRAAGLAIVVCWAVEDMLHLQPSDRTRRMQQLARADVIFVYSNNQVSLLESWGFPRGKAVAIPFGVETGFFSLPEKPIDDGVGREMREGIIAVGNDRGRDYQTLFDAVAGTGINVTLYSRPEAVSSLTLPKEVDYRGVVSRIEYRDALRNAVAVAVPVHELAYPTGQSVAMEGAACGALVITTSTPAMSAYFQHGKTALFSEPSDAHGLRTNLAAALSDTEVRHIQAAGTEMVRTRFSTDAMWDAMWPHILRISGR